MRKMRREDRDGCRKASFVSLVRFVRRCAWLDTSCVWVVGNYLLGLFHGDSALYERQELVYKIKRNNWEKFLDFIFRQTLRNRSDFIMCSRDIL